jgi:hypothetical protein
MTLRSPLTTSMMPISLITASDRWEERAHTTKGIVRWERTCDPEFLLWLCHHCLVGDCIRVRMRGVIFPHTFDS